MLKLLKLAVACAALFVVTRNARGEIIFFTDGTGQVGRWDTETNTGAAFGNLSGVTSSAFITGLAYDPARDSILMFDEIAKKVYGMNAQTGEASFLFQLTVSIPEISEPFAIGITDGAVANGFIYSPGPGSPSQPYSLADGTLHPSPGSGDGIWLMGAVGVNPETNMLYTQFRESPIFEVRLDGTPAEEFLTPSIPLNLADIDYFNGDFIGIGEVNMDFDGETIYAVLIDGTTGEVTPFLTEAQLKSMGLVDDLFGIGNASGVVVYNPVPEPASLVLFAIGAAAIAAGVYRRPTAA